MKDMETMNKNKKPQRRFRTKVLGVMITLSALGFGAVAQPSSTKQDEVEETTINVNADLILLPSVSFEEQSIKVEYRIGRRRFTVQTENGDSVLVEIDGIPVPDDRIHRKNGKLVIFDEEGNEIQTLHLFSKFSHEFMFKMMSRGEPRSRSMGFGFPSNPELMGLAEQFTTFEFEYVPPNVMLGIFTEETSPALEKHLGLEVDATVTITGLNEGLPAHQAGLEVHDIILSVDGRQPVSKHVIYEVLMEKTEGETLELSIIQAGEKKSYFVTLESFDRKRMRDANLIGSHPYRFRRSQRRSRRFPSLAISPILQGVLVPPDSSQIFRYAPEGFDPGVQAEIRTLIRMLNISKEGKPRDEVMEFKFQLQNQQDPPEEPRSPAEDRPEEDQ